jgi:hypothetical protein
MCHLITRTRGSRVQVPYEAWIRVRVSLCCVIRCWHGPCDDRISRPWTHSEFRKPEFEQTTRPNAQELWKGHVKAVHDYCPLQHQELGYYYRPTVWPLSVHRQTSVKWPWPSCDQRREAGCWLASLTETLQYWQRDILKRERERGSPAPPPRAGDVNASHPTFVTSQKLSAARG